MKKLIYVLLILFPTILVGQNYRWEVIHGIQTRNEGFSSIVEDYDKGLFVSGNRWIGYEGDGWGFKTDVNGNLLYDKILSHGEHTLSLKSVTHDLDGNKYMCGTFWDGHSWPFIIKLDSCGNIVWCNALRDDNFDYGGSEDIFVTKNNVVLLITYYTNYQNSADKIHIIAFDSEGNKLWMKPYASENNYPLIENLSIQDCIQFNSDYYLSGFCYYPFPHDPNHLWLRPLFIGIDSLFNEKFVVPFMKTDSVFGMAHGIIPINDSILMGIGGNYNLSDSNKIEVSMMFINTEGTEIGLSHIPINNFPPDIEIAAAGSGALINDSTFISLAGLGTESPEGGYRSHILFNSSGDLLKMKPDSTLVVGKMIKTSDSNFVVGGNIMQNNSLWKDIIMYKLNDSLESVPFDTTQYVYDSLCPHSIQSGTIDLYDCLTVVDIGELPTPQEYFESIRWIPVKVYPNPATEGCVNLEFENTNHHQNMELLCYDDFGRQVHSQKIYKGQQNTDLNVSAWPPGIYIAVVYSDGSARGKAKFVVR